MLKRGNSVTDMCDSETVMDAIHPRFLEKPIVVYRGTVLSEIINYLTNYYVIALLTYLG